jgi:hypothetical protein
MTSAAFLTSDPHKDIKQPSLFWDLPNKAYGKAYAVLVIFAVMVFMASLAKADLSYTEATGRAVIQHEATADEARMLALEDALYLAALQGGARIDGFSSVSTDTSLSDHFVIRPASTIMDYTIVNEVQDDTHYSVTIRAVIGQKPESTCQRAMANATIYQARFKTSPNVPAWTAAYSRVLSKELKTRLSDDPRLALVNASNKPFSPANLAKGNDEFDYMTLTNGKISVAHGDFAIYPEIIMEHKKSANGVFRQDRLILTVMLHAFHGRTYEPAFSKSVTTEIPLKISTPFKTLDQLSRASRTELAAAMSQSVPMVANQTISAMLCEPLSARLTLVGNTLSVPFGRDQGLHENSLAVTNGSETGWTVLRVTNLTNQSAHLVPLDKSRDTTPLVGKSVEFMELSQ